MGLVGALRPRRGGEARLACELAGRLRRLGGDIRRVPRESRAAGPSPPPLEGGGRGEGAGGPAIHDLPSHGRQPAPTRAARPRTRRKQDPPRSTRSARLTLHGIGPILPRHGRPKDRLRPAIHDLPSLGRQPAPTGAARPADPPQARHNTSKARRTTRAARPGDPSQARPTAMALCAAGRRVGRSAVRGGSWSVWTSTADPGRGPSSWPSALR